MREVAGENYVRRRFVICSLLVCSAPNVVSLISLRIEGHMALMREERKVYKVLVGKLKERDHSEDRGVDGRMESEWILQLGSLVGGGVEWIQLAQEMDRWRALVNAVINLWVLAPRS
jgi:hypothetical protein